MVAPFMSHIKKWIGQQRRKDDAVMHTEEQLVAHGLDARQAVDEQPSPSPQHAAIEPQLPFVQQGNGPVLTVDRSEELKRLLYIGGPGPAPVQQTPSLQQSSQANNLLAMLQGGPTGNQAVPPPQTPMDQLNAFMPTQPESPHPRHPRQPPSGYQPPPPQFPIAQPGIRQYHPQQGMSIAPSGFGQPTNDPSVHLDRSPHVQHEGLQHVQSHMSSNLSAQPYPHPQPTGCFDQSHTQAQQSYPSHPAQAVLPSRHASSGQFQLQGQHGAIASGPSAPNASQLPPPRLTAQSMKLLDAFKTGQKVSHQPNSLSAQPRSGSAHQNALLGLFKPSPAPEAARATQDPRAEQAIVSPGPDEVPQRPTQLQERRPTLNEITRSLPLNFKAKRPSQHAPAMPQQLTSAATSVPRPSSAVPDDSAPPAVQPNMPVPHQQAASPNTQSPANGTKTRNANGPKEPKHKDVPAVSVKQIMQRRGGRQGSVRGPRDKSADSPSPARQAKGKPSEPPVPVTILARPGSAREKPGSPASGSPKHSFQPQLLKRQDGAELPATSPNGYADANAGNSSGDGSGKRDQLLALFNKSPSVPQAQREELPAAVPTSSPAQFIPPASANANNNPLLNLLNASAPAQRASPEPSPEPPAAPALQPTHRPNKPRTPAPPPIISHPPQNALLDLFKKPAHAQSPSIDTPISPFNLGSPHAMRHGQGLPGRTERPRSRLGSVASGSGSGHATPTEQKDFLLGFLNGVVQKEGQRK